MKVVGLYVHPVKSTRIRDVASALVTPAGFVGDREWMVVDADGQIVSAREVPALFDITADTRATGHAGDLRLIHPELAPLELAAPTTGDCSVTMFNRPPMRARSAGGPAAAWLQAATGVPGLQLVWCDDPTRRRLNPLYSKPSDCAAFQDGSPVTLLGLASVQQLSEWQGPPQDDSMALTCHRFRPNIVIDGAAAFAEDTWQRVSIGAVDFRVAGPVDRCVMTTIDPATGHRGPEPIRTMARYRKWDGKTWLAVRLIPDSTGTVAVGDAVLPTDRQGRRNTRQGGYIPSRNFIGCDEWGSM